MTASAAQVSPVEVYIHRVLAHLPSAPTLRAQIAMDLRSHIAERMEHGQSMDDVVRQLGDPATLAESYLGAIPLVAATFDQRVLAKLIDFVMVWAWCGIFALGVVWLVWGSTALETLLIWAPMSLALAAIALSIYTITAEYRTGQTIGRRLRHLRVVRESGASISLGQSFVRQLPLFLQISLIDCLFALFTEKSQRAFEIISKTRVVRVPPDESAAA